MSRVLLPIKPQHVENIFKLTKRYEYRKVKCKREISEIVIYCTAPVSKIVGTAKVISVIEGTPEDIWEQTEEKSGISYEAFQKYYGDREYAVAYQLGVITQFRKHEELSFYKIRKTPQSYIYLD